jgi:hypothetical protein
MREDVGRFEDDIRLWAKDTLEKAAVPERLWENIFEAGMRFRPPNATILWLGPWLIETAREVMSPLERDDSLVKTMTDRQLLEKIYRKLYM